MEKRGGLFFILFLITVFIISFTLAKTYEGEGKYTLKPADVVNLKEGYRLKYFSYQEDVEWYEQGGLASGDLASIVIFNKTGNLDYYGDSIPVANLGYKSEGIRTFSSGFHFTLFPLTEWSDKFTIEVFEGVLSSCVDTDAYTL